MKSPILNPKREYMMLSDLSPKIIRDSEKKRQVSPHRLRLNRTLNREIRPESAPDSKSSSQKSGGFLGGFAWYDWLGQKVRRYENG